jgi:hypothetical protein
VAAAHGSRGDHASTRLVGIRGRGDFDRVGIAVDLDNKRCVIEVAFVADAGVAASKASKTRPFKRTQ